jgi:UV DNA damage endonuclease
MTWTRFNSLPRKEAIDILCSRILNNFQVTNKVIKYCFDNDIKGYRMSSNIVPLINHPELNISLQDLPNWNEIFNEIKNIRQTLSATGVRISAHPSEYISLTSDCSNIILNSIRDLQQHAEIFDLLDLPVSHWSPLNIHIRQDGNPNEIYEKFARNFDKLSDSVKKRLVIEVNDNKDGTWHIPNLVDYVFNKLKLPITFDSLHNKLCNIGHSEKEMFDMAYSTWDTVPLFHYSEGVNGTRKHADYANLLPEDYGKEVFWDVELKQKDYAIAQIIKNKITLQKNQ